MISSHNHVARPREHHNEEWLRCRICFVWLDNGGTPLTCSTPGCTNPPTHQNGPIHGPYRPTCTEHEEFFKRGGEVKTRFDKLVRVPPGKDWCLECGHVDDPLQFIANNECPHPVCPRPHKWR